MTTRDSSKSYDMRHNKYTSQSNDANTFFRATAKIFWQDFVNHGWGNFDLEELGGTANALADGSPLERKSTWTWITGDQHLSNFGAWRNRHGDVVFDVNDFDESAIYDFQIDIWRLAVSIRNHALTNGIKPGDADNLVMFFCDEYVRKLQEYVGNEQALLFEITQSVATGLLQQFLNGVLNQQSAHKQLSKFTEVDEKLGERRLVKSTATQLEEVSSDVEKEVRRAFGPLNYGATLSMIGWRAKAWNDDFFRVLDVARRVGGGIGSYGVPRYYVLLAGEDTVGPGGSNEGGKGGIILDVKFEPHDSAYVSVLEPQDLAWYKNIFLNDAMRAVEAQRRLTSYTDPFAGWVLIGGKAHVVRQLSPWKKGFPFDSLRTYDDLAEFVSQIAVITATSHARGTYAKSPAQFKEVIAAVLGRYPAHKTWGASVAQVAEAYREQVLIDFKCFKEFVNRNYTMPVKHPEHPNAGAAQTDPDD